jgi:hypothetical protein
MHDLLTEPIVLRSGSHLGKVSLLRLRREGRIAHRSRSPCDKQQASPSQALLCLPRGRRYHLIRYFIHQLAETTWRRFCIPKRTELEVSSMHTASSTIPNRHIARRGGNDLKPWNTTSTNPYTSQNKVPPSSPLPRPVRRTKRRGKKQRSKHMKTSTKNSHSAI